MDLGVAPHKPALPDWLHVLGQPTSSSSPPSLPYFPFWPCSLSLTHSLTAPAPSSSLSPRPPRRQIRYPACHAHHPSPVSFLPNSTYLILSWLLHLPIYLLIASLDPKHILNRQQHHQRHASSRSSCLCRVPWLAPARPRQKCHPRSSSARRGCEITHYTYFPCWSTPLPAAEIAPSTIDHSSSLLKSPGSLEQSPTFQPPDPSRLLESTAVTMSSFYS